MELVPPVLRWHMTIFRAIGYCTLPPNGNLKGGRWFISWSLLLIILFNILTYLAFFGKDSLLFTNDAFGYFNDVLKFVFADIAVTSSYILSISKRSYLHDFWLCYEKLQRKSRNETRLSWRKGIWQNRRFLAIFYAAITCDVVAMIIFINVQEMTRRLALCWSVFAPFIYAVHLRNLQFICYIEVIRLELVKLNQDLQLLVEYSRFHAYGTGFRGFQEFLRGKILDKQKNYQCIYEMFDNFQKSFGLSIIAVLVMVYVRVLVDSYFGYYTNYRGWNNVETVLLLPACLQIPIFLITSKNCMDVLQNFSLQILHQRICINGIGITRMDGYMLVKAIGSVTTYMIFFIQFMPKFSNIEVVN